MSDVTIPNFCCTEFRCKCPVCHGVVYHKMQPHVLNALHAMRVAYGKPIYLSSAYRCGLHPKEVVKEKAGTHNQGLALDIVVPWGADRMELLFIAKALGFRGFGFADSFIHIDMRDGPTTSWCY